MTPHKNHNRGTSYFAFLLLLLAANLVSVVSATESSLCKIPSPTPEHLAAGKDAFPLLASFRLSAGYFFGGEDIHFARDKSDDGGMLHVPRTFSLFPLHVDRTSDSDLIHVAGTLTLSGDRANHGVVARRRRSSFGGSHSISFHLDGYYSSTTAVLCMAGSGAYTTEEGNSFEHLADVVLRLRVPNPASLSDPFVTGQIKGAGFEAVYLVAYAEGDGYKYRERASCPSAQPSVATARGALRALGGANFSCSRLREELVSLYKLQHGGGGAPALLRGLQEPRMHVDQVQCTADGAVRLYATFSNNMNLWGQQLLPPRTRFEVKEDAVVAEGHWDSARSMLCLKACRLVRSGPTILAVQEQECDIGMSFWFPAVWAIQKRSVVAGTIWNSSRETGSSIAAAGEISASSIDFDEKRSNFSDVEYRYTMVEEVKEHYWNALSNSHNNKESFPAANYTYRDFEFHFSMDENGSGFGEAHPVTIGSAIVYGDRLAAEDSFSRHAVVGTEDELVTISYDIRTRHIRSAMNFRRPNNINFSSLTIEERQMTAEGVYDPKRGVLCMIGCQEFNSSLTDCQILITVQFESLDAKAQGNGKGVIRSLRGKTDSLYFDKMDISLYGMFTEQVSEAISRMDMESIILVASTTLLCVFTALQILHAKRNPEASAATSITMLVILALGYVTPLVISSEALFTSRRKQYAPFQSYVPYELSQAMLRAPTLIAFVLQLRLLQLAWSGRNKAKTWSAAERKALWVCLPLYYLLGGGLTIVLHLINGRAARQDWLNVRIGPEPVTLLEDLVSSAGLVLDGFLLPQVAMNVFSGSRVRAISPLFYVGSSVIRAMPHVYDVIRARGYVPSMKPSNIYASYRDDRFGMAWDIIVPCGVALLALLLFLQQRLGGAFFLRSRRRLGEYEMVSIL